MEGDLLDDSQEDLVRKCLMFLLCQAVTTELLAVRAARGSSRDPSGRRQDTSVGERGSVLSTRLRGTDVNIAASGM